MATLLDKLYDNILSDKMNTEICQKNVDVDLKNNDKSLRIQEQMNKVSSLLSFFSGTTTDGSSENNEIENNSGSTANTKVSLSELTDIFSYEKKNGLQESSFSRKRSSTSETEMDMSKRKRRLNSHCPEIPRVNEWESRSTLSDDMAINGKRSIESTIGQFNRTNSFQDKLPDEEVALHPLTPNIITQQVNNLPEPNTISNPTEFSSAQENSPELEEMPKLKEVSPITKDAFPPLESNGFVEKKRCEYGTCGYFSESDERYRFHIKGHVNSSAFKCSYCDLNFAGLTYLSSHEKVCTLKNVIEKDGPKPIATSTPAVIFNRNDKINIAKPQRINFNQTLTETPGPSFHDALQKKPSQFIPNKDNIPIQIMNSSFKQQQAKKDIVKTTPIMNSPNMPESTAARKKPFEMANSSGVILANPSLQDKPVYQLPKPPVLIPIQPPPNEVKKRRIYCKVDSCEFSTEIETLYRDHYCEFHNRESNEICEYCSSGFSNKKILSQHKFKYCKIAASCIKKLHTDPRVDPNFLRKPMERQVFIDNDKREICLYECDYRGTSELDMVNHISNFHQAEGRFPCSSCELKFSSNDLLAAHEELYCSKISEMSISRIKGLTSEYRCPHVTCNFSTYVIKEFRQHLNGHCDNFTTRHSCNNCKQYFSNASILEEHTRFPCTYKKTKKELNIVNTLVDIMYETC
uniref:C2H2-type domain-containing protein n=1 Tax=Strongyloides venezuelensis TaxID=75913 RepID=A0A0K0FNT2_STRVS